MTQLQIKWFPGSDKVHLPEGLKDAIRRLFTIEGAEDFAVTAILVSAVITVLTFFIVLIGKSIFNYRSRKKHKILKDCEALLSLILFEEKNPVVAERRQKLEKLLLSSRFSRNVLLDEVIHLHRNLLGEAGDTLREYYFESGLKDVSMRKLKSRKWYVVCRGCQELSEMQVRAATVQLKVLTAHRFAAVREQAQLAYIELTGFKGIDFVFTYDKELTEWQQINLIRILEKHATELPDLPSLQNNRNESVIAFILRLITHFQIHDADQLLLQAIRLPSDEIRMLCIQAAVILQRTDLKARILLLFPYASELLREKILLSLAHIGNKTDLQFLKEQLQGNNTLLRFAAMKASLQLTDRAYCEQLAAGDAINQAILKHLSDPYLNE